MACLGLIPSPILGGEDPKIETVVENLINPCAIAIHANHGIFISESGAGRIHKIIDGQAKIVIERFPIDSYGRSPAYKIGPLGLAVTSNGHLLVGEGGQPASRDRLIAYSIDKLTDPIQSDQTVSVAALSSQEFPAEGNFYGVATFGNQVFTTCHGDDSKGWVAKAELEDGRLIGFDRFVATRELVQTDAPTAIAIEPNLGHIWISLFGETNVRADGVILKLDRTGKAIGTYYTGLNDITGIAFCPKTSRMFVTDFSWMDESEGGLFELSNFDAAGEYCTAHKVISLSRPTALAFSTDGTLWVSVLGESRNQSSNGKLLKITDLPSNPPK